MARTQFQHIVNIPCGQVVTRGQGELIVNALCEWQSFWCSALGEDTEVWTLRIWIFD